MFISQGTEQIARCCSIYFEAYSSSTVNNYPPFMEPQVHDRILKDPPLDLILSQINPLYIHTHFLFTVHLILASKEAYTKTSHRFS
jgi:hypothetical protein